MRYVEVVLVSDGELQAHVGGTPVFEREAQCCWFIGQSTRALSTKDVRCAIIVPSSAAGVRAIGRIVHLS